MVKKYSKYKYSCICLLILLRFIFLPSILADIHVVPGIAADSIKKKRTDVFFDTLQSKASQRKLTRELYEIMVQQEKKDAALNKPEVTNDSQEQYDNKLIRRIEIVKLGVFGTGFKEESSNEQPLIEKAANTFHVNTSRRIVNNNLIVKSGHYFDHNQIADNERILRELPSINDARIMVGQVDTINNTVDLVVYIRDVWSTGFGLATSDFSKGNVDLWDKNIFGTGHEFSNTIVWDSDKEQKTGYKAHYRIRNLKGSFINTEVNYISVFDHNEYNVKIDREFFTPETKLSGGFEYRNVQKDEVVKHLFEFDTSYLINYDYTKIWGARAFPLKVSSNSDYRSNIVFSLGYLKYDYFEAPPVMPDLLHKYQSRAMFLGGISLTSQAFYKTNYIYSFGRTEDIPMGLLIGLRLGFERNEFKDRIYTHLTFKSAYHYFKTGYLFNSFDLSAYADQNGNMEQGAANIRLNYFSDLYKINRARFRQFIKINYLSGFGRYADETISLNRSQGIRGFRTDSIFAPKKMVFSFESVLFTPIYFYGFRFVFYSFFDVGYAGPSNKVILSNSPNTGIGVGIRIRNDRLSFRTLQIQFGYYPLAPPDVDRLMLSGSGEPRLRPENFYVKEPDVFEYR